jgi:CDP-diacylglycerol---glycerol-3-phosphate 3-phosphatidyltransferase
MTSTDLGLYALKPWYARRLRRVVASLERHGATPDQVSGAGVLFGAAAGAVTACVAPGPATAVLVAGLLAARLACANMDGTLARRRPSSRAGGLSNELGDRLADVLMLGCFVPHLGWAAFAVLFGATLPSWAALAVAAQGAPRSNAGPVGKTERCLLVVVAAATGWFAGAALVITVGGLLTAAVRVAVGRRRLCAGSAR